VLGGDSKFRSGSGSIGVTSTPDEVCCKSRTQLDLNTLANMQKACGPSSMNGLRTAVRTGYTTPYSRHVSDIAITRTGKPILRTQGGR